MQTENPTKNYKKYLPYGIAGCVVLALLALFAGIGLFLVLGGLPFLSGSGNQMLVAFVSRNRMVDLYLLKKNQQPQKGILLVENAEKANIYGSIGDESNRYEFTMSDMGAFVPGSNQVLFWYLDDNKTILNIAATSGKGISTILESKEDYLYVWMPSQTSNFALIFEPKGSEIRCYITRKWGEAVRLAKGENIAFPKNGKFIVYSEIHSQKTTLRRIDTASEKEILLLDDEPDVGWFQLSKDGRILVYFKQSSSGGQLIAIDAANGNPVWESEKYDQIPNFTFASDGHDFAFIANDGVGKLKLIAYHKDREIEVTQSYGLDFRFSTDGKYLLHQSMDKKGEITLSSYDFASQNSLEIKQFDNAVDLATIEDKSGFLLIDNSDGNATLYYVTDNGETLTKLYQQRDGNLVQVLYLEGKKDILLRTSGMDGESLILTPYNQEDKGLVLLEEWAEIVPLNISPDFKTIVIKGRQDSNDDWILYAIDLRGKNDPLELDDDAKDYLNAVFSKNSKDIIYTARTGYNDNDVEILQKNLNSKDRPQVLYEEAVLESVQWGRLINDFTLYFWNSLID